MGLAALCTQVFQVLRMLASALAKAAMPVLSRIADQGEDKDALFLRSMALISASCRH
jgi:O-antigen/teichoic acid export membrane protein